MRKIVLALLAIGVSVVSSGELRYSSQYQHCLDHSGGVTSDMRACNGQELAYQDRLLNRNYKKAIRVLNREKKKELKTVQRLWIEYRDAKCGFEYGLTGGTMDLANGDGCLVDMTAERAEELAVIVDTL